MSILTPIGSFFHDWSDFWVFLSAIATLALAVATFCVIRQGQRQRDGGVDAWSGRGALIETTPPAPDNPSCGIVAIRCVLRNVGVGPALRLRLKFRFLDMDDWTSEPWELSPLGAGEGYGSEAVPLLVPFPIHERFNHTDFAMLTGKPWEIWLEYEDVFGRQFQSVHRKAPFNSDPSTFTWTSASSGRQPKAVMRPIPWLNYSEGPMQ